MRLNCNLEYFMRNKFVKQLLGKIGWLLLSLRWFNNENDYEKNNCNVCINTVSHSFMQ